MDSNKDLLEALNAIAHMQVEEDTDFRQLAALCIGLAKITLQRSNGWHDWLNEQVPSSVDYAYPDENKYGH